MLSGESRARCRLASSPNRASLPWAHGRSCSCLSSVGFLCSGFCCQGQDRAPGSLDRECWLCGFLGMCPPCRPPVAAPVAWLHTWDSSAGTPWPTSSACLWIPSPSAATSAHPCAVSSLPSLQFCQVLRVHPGGDRAAPWTSSVCEAKERRGDLSPADPEAPRDEPWIRCPAATH